jgi:methionine-rich copper-binding protein CopC
MSTSFAALSRSSALTGALAIVATVGLSASAAAHNFVVSSTPENDQVITVLPEVWQLTTNEQMLDLGGEGAGFAMLIADESGLFYGDGCITIDGPTMSTPAALGEPGQYSMVYQFISADGHTLSDELTFMWEPTEAGEPHIGLAEPPMCGETASAPAPAPEPSPTATPDSSPPAPLETESQPSEPVSGEASPLFVVGVVAVIAAVAGVVTAAVLRARGRRRNDRRTAPEGAED